MTFLLLAHIRARLLLARSARPQDSAAHSPRKTSLFDIVAIFGNTENFQLSVQR
jgi:hypothetical protein